jgi:phthiodiolone/phenolphthiodiolone dimycocerosates ketoreductase
MKVQPAAFMRTVLPLGMDMVEHYDSGRYHSVWLPDHMVSFTPDSIWSPEFTDLATTSHSPHRHLDAMIVAGAVATMTKHVPIATSVVDTVRRHPAMLAQAALTLDHLSEGRFILGIGSGEAANTVPYGFDFSKPASRFEEALHVIRLLWDSEGPVSFDGQFYRLDNARMDTDLYGGKPPRIWAACSGPRMLELAGRYVDGWWPHGAWTADDYSIQLDAIRRSAERSGRDPMSIVPANIIMCVIGEDDEVEDMLEAPLVKARALSLPASDLQRFGYEHPMGPKWRGGVDINPATLTREKILDFCAKLDTQVLRDFLLCGTPKHVAAKVKEFCDAGMRVFKVSDQGGSAGKRFSARSPEKVRVTEDEVLRLVGDGGT